MNDINKNNVPLSKKTIYYNKYPIQNYFDNINTESDLYNLYKLDSKCNDIYSKNNNNFILSYDNKNYKDIEFSKNIKKCSLNNVKKNKNKTYNCKNQINLNQTDTILKYNYKSRNYKTCNTGCLPKVDNYTPNKNNIIIKQIKMDTNNQSTLIVGPERNEHTIENLWNNNTKRTFL